MDGSSLGGRDDRDRQCEEGKTRSLSFREGPPRRERLRPHLPLEVTCEWAMEREHAHEEKRRDREPAASYPDAGFRA